MGGFLFEVEVGACGVVIAADAVGAGWVIFLDVSVGGEDGYGGLEVVGVG